MVIDDLYFPELHQLLQEPRFALYQMDAKIMNFDDCHPMFKYIHVFMYRHPQESKYTYTRIYSIGLKDCSRMPGDYWAGYIKTSQSVRDALVYKQSLVYAKRSGDTIELRGCGASAAMFYIINPPT